MTTTNDTPDNTSNTHATGQPRVLLRVEEAAERLAISRAQMFIYLKHNVIQSVKIGRLRRIPADAIDAYIQRLASEQNIA
jgi:excisionase family DNA binding protein